MLMEMLLARALPLLLELTALAARLGELTLKLDDRLLELSVLLLGGLPFGLTQLAQLLNLGPQGVLVLQRLGEVVLDCQRVQFAQIALAAQLANLLGDFLEALLQLTVLLAELSVLELEMMLFGLELEPLGLQLLQRGPTRARNLTGLFKSALELDNASGALLGLLPKRLNLDIQTSLLALAASPLLGKFPMSFGQGCLGLGKLILGIEKLTGQSVGHLLHAGAGLLKLLDALSILTIILVTQLGERQLLLLELSLGLEQLSVAFGQA